MHPNVGRASVAQSSGAPRLRGRSPSSSTPILTTACWPWQPSSGPNQLTLTSTVQTSNLPPGNFRLNTP
ncbi:uncharacterized protein CC84DRAFT_1168424 [Paraphaeosphaeria sporulosa]|uniref:Uncharacterized protein n=1 Tax=Paraphaeosphaeria sporulosa TaxID=1460663 RepID=A0A177C088_9PLEO|nr:uncharacterized protein CC84DRAFT_1168424 [Paraphaeosphaeria sporulosa]OAG00309.1 hypothetical protein CC84DRAFT_1168424 [Paraphaeosphaeria sporulosa]